MIITRIAVENVGRFRARHVVRGLGPGLNLLCAPNEAGKSTIFRALQAALFARHGSKDKEIRALGCLSAELPAVVEVGFTRDGADYLVRKTFLRSPSSRLLKAGVAIAEGRAADEAAWAILGLAPGAAAVEDNAFGLLWVRQGQSFEPAAPTGEARAALNRVIEAEVGQVVGGERGERAARRVAAQLAEQETDKGKPRAGGEWKQALDRVADMRQSLDSVRATLAALESDRAALAARRRERASLADPEALRQMQADLARAQDEREAAARQEQAAHKAEAESANRELALERVAARHKRLVECDQRIAAARARIHDLAARIGEREATFLSQAAAVGAKEQALENLAACLDAAERAVDAARARETAAHDAERVADLRARLDQARTLRERLGLLRQALARVDVAPEALRRIEKASQDLDSARARRDAKAPQLAITLGPLGFGRVACEGAILAQSRAFPAVAPVRIEVEHVASIEITPAAAPDDAKLVEQARQAFERALQAAGARSLAEARERRAKAEDFATEQRGLGAELAAVAPAGAGGEDGVSVLEKTLAEAQANLAALAREGDERGEDGAAGEGRAARLAQRLAAEEARDSLRRDHRAAQAALAVARNDLAAEKERLAAVRAERSAAQERLAEDLAAAPDAERADALTTLAAEAALARAAFEQAEAEARRLRAAVPSDEQRAALDARAKRLTDAIERQRRRLQDLDEEILRLRVTIDGRGGEGLGERESELADALALAESDLARVERRLAALRLLRDTIEACRREARETFLAPVKRAMRPYLQTLFPGAEAALDERFAIDAVQRGGPEPEPFDSLSDGTREQIAIIVRLALARLLAERGQPVPIVLDDSLVFSDDERIERMFDVLTQAAEKQQAIVLTCRSRAFQSCGGRPLAIEPEAC